MLCDVPCSGLGIITKKPEIKYKNLDEIKELIPIVANTSIDLRCYEITMVENREKNEINVTIQGTLDISN